MLVAGGAIKIRPRWIRGDWIWTRLLRAHEITSLSAMHLSAGGYSPGGGRGWYFSGLAFDVTVWAPTHQLFLASEVKLEFREDTKKWP